MVFQVRNKLGANLVALINCSSHIGRVVMYGENRQGGMLPGSLNHIVLSILRLAYKIVAVDFGPTFLNANGFKLQMHSETVRLTQGTKG
ncbi:MAG: hypothetical protein U0V54_13315 [Saprospiraceae bacterium]